MAGAPSRTPDLSRLPRGQHGLAREEVLASQRARLQAAMVSCVAKDGYANVTLRDLARVAAVSPNVFYSCFADKEQCFLATHDAIAEGALARVRAALDAAEGWQARLRATIDSFLAVVIEQPDAAYLAMVEIHAVGAAALEHQQQALDDHERLLREVFADAPDADLISDTTVKALVAGARGLIARELGEGNSSAGLTRLAPALESWALCYQGSLPAPLPEPFAEHKRAPARLPVAAPSAAAPAGGHRERIMRAVAAISCEEGYSALRMPSIARRAGVSNQTFYEHFQNKHEAFLACYDRSSRRVLAALLQSFQAAPDWPHAVRASLATLLAHIAAEPEFARLGLFEILAAGADARRRADDRAAALTAMLTPGAPLDTPAPPRLLGALVAAGIWGVIQHHIVHGRTSRLPELTPQLTYMALAPFVGSLKAWQVAQEA
jgi:AcrR family transcriptional regulator